MELNAIKVLYHKILNRVKRAVVRLYRCIVPVSLSAAQLDFVKHNAAFWKRYFPANRARKNSGYVLVADERHPLTSFSVASFASIVAQAKKLNLLFVSRLLKNDVKIRIFRSYPGSVSFLYLHGCRYLIMRIFAAVAAAKAYRSIKTPQELLKFKVDGIRFGDVLYDAVLAGGYATIDVIDHRLLHRLRQFYFFRLCIKDIIRRYDIQTSAFGHIVGLYGSVFSRYLLQHGIEVLHRVGSHQIVAKKYRTLQEIGVYTNKLEQKYFHMMMQGDSDTIVRLTDEYFDRRINCKVEHDCDASLAYNLQKKTFTDKQSFCAEYNLDYTKPIVFVMLHAFNDFPHSHFSKPMMFQDYYHSFLRTLEIAQTVETVNWVFKEHPAARYYLTKDVNLNEIFERIKSHHICFLNSEADFNSRSIQYLAKTIITCTGTAGLEHALLGIPCVLTGESPYSGFGFTIEPQDAQAYETCLRNIDQLPPLNHSQIKAAKVFAYFYLCLYHDGLNYSFCPYFSFDKIKDWKDEYSDQLWKKAAEQFRNEQHVQKMVSLVQEISRFVLDGSWTQYFDVRQLRAKSIL